MPKPHCGLTAPRRTTNISANWPHLRLQGASRFNPFAAQSALPLPAGLLAFCSRFAACSLSPAACGFTTAFSASSPSRPTMASAAGRDRPAPPLALSTLNFCRHGSRGAKPRPLHARLGATPPCCFGRFAPFAPPGRPISLAARTTAGCTRLCPAKSPTSASPTASCAHHGRGKLLTSAQAGFSLAQVLAFCNHLLQARWRPNQKLLG